MKIFLDTADLTEIRRAADAGLIDGVTTNPTLLARASEGRDAKEIFREIAEIVDGPVSAEVVGLDAETMISEGLRLADLHPDIVIKVPLTTDQGFFRKELDEVDTSSAPRGGTLIGDAIRKAIESFDPAPNRDQVMVLITDGEDHDS